MIAAGIWSEDEHAKLQKELEADVLKAQKEAESYGSLADGHLFSNSTMFDDIYKDVPDHLELGSKFGMAMKVGLPYSMVSEVIIDQLTRAGAKVLTADGADLTSAEGDPTRTLIRQVLGAVAQFDKSVTVLKLRAAMERIRRREGRCEGPRRDKLRAAASPSDTESESVRRAV
jgi:hypothetical protein